MSLKNYFNKKSFGPFGHGKQAVVGMLISTGLLASGFAPVIAAGVVTSIVTCGQINEWQKEATGKHIWKPKIPGLGL